MAHASVALIRALRTTAERLKSGAEYQWGHFGACNCGHLAQTITRRTKAEIHQLAMRQRAIDWADEAQEFESSSACRASGMSFDEVLDELVQAGLTPRDIAELENLENEQILRRMPPDRRYLRRNVRDDAVAYFEAWAELLEEELFRTRAESLENKGKQRDAA